MSTAPPSVERVVYCHRCAGRSATCWWCDAERVLSEVQP